MTEKPKTASEYKSEQVELVRAACLYVATKLGDMMDDLVIVGGLVPSLIVDQGSLPEDTEAHVGTMDLDVGLQLALLDEGRYRKLTERLRDAGFAMDTNDAGNPTRQRWAITGSGTVTIDFPNGRSRRRPPGRRRRFRGPTTGQARRALDEKAPRRRYVPDELCFTSTEDCCRGHRPMGFRWCWASSRQTPCHRRRSAHHGHHHHHHRCSRGRYRRRR